MLHILTSVGVVSVCILAILIGVQWSLLVLICGFLMTYDVEDPFVCLLSLSISSLDIFNWDFVFILLGFSCFMYILDWIPLLDKHFENIFSSLCLIFPLS